MIVTGHPQFDTQDDDGMGNGIPPIAEWQLDPSMSEDDLPELGDIEVDFPVRNVFIRLRNVFRRAQRMPLSTTKLHDLTCFVVHRLLLSADTPYSQPSPITECIRYGIILYMFLIQGTTYFSHTVMLNTLVERFMDHVRLLESTRHLCGSLDIWYLTAGMAASAGTENYPFFLERAQALATSMELESWDGILYHIRSVLWLEAPQSEHIFRAHWETLLGVAYPSTPADLMLSSSSNIVDTLVLPSPYSSPTISSVEEDRL